MDALLFVLNLFDNKSALKEPFCKTMHRFVCVSVCVSVCFCNGEGKEHVSDLAFEPPC